MCVCVSGCVKETENVEKMCPVVWDSLFDTEIPLFSPWEKLYHFMFRIDCVCPTDNKIPFLHHVCSLQPFAKLLMPFFLFSFFVTAGHSVTLATPHPLKGEEPSPGTMEVAGTPGLAPSPQSEAVTSELQELSLQPAPDPMPLQERKNGEAVRHSHFLLS